MSQATAGRYLDALSNGGILEEYKLGRENYCINHALVEMLFKRPGVAEEAL